MCSFLDTAAYKLIEIAFLGDDDDYIMEECIEEGACVENCVESIEANIRKCLLRRTRTPSVEMEISSNGSKPGSDGSRRIRTISGMSDHCVRLLCLKLKVLF